MKVKLQIEKRMRFYFRTIKILVISLAFYQHLLAADTVLVDFKSFPANIISMARDREGMIWLNSGTGLYQFDGRKIKWKSDSFKQGTLVCWKDKVYTRERLEKIGISTPDPWIRNTEKWAKHLPGESSIVSVAKDSYGVIWVTNGQNLFGFKINPQFDLLLPGQSIRGILQDGADMYVNTYSGIFKNNRKVLDNLFSQGNSLKISDTELFITTGNLLRYNKVENSTITIPFSNTEKTTSLVAQANSPHKGLNYIYLNQHQASIWVGTTCGLFQLKNDSLYYTGFPYWTEYIHPFNDELLLATPEGIFKWVNQTFERDNRFPKLYYNSIYQIGNKWWATSQSGIWVCEGEKKAKKLFEDLPLGNLETYCLEEDPSGFIWVSTVSGLYRFKPGQLQYESFLPSEEFNKRSSASIRDSLYFGTIRGIIRFKPSDFVHKQAEQPYGLIPNWIILGIIILVVLSALNFILWKKWKKAVAVIESQKNSLSQVENSLISTLRTYINQNISTVTVESMSAHINMNPRTLYRLMETNFSMKPGDLIRTEKLSRIQEIQDSNPNIDMSSLASQVGYSVPHLKRLLEKHSEVD